LRYDSPKNPHKKSENAVAKPFSSYELSIIGLTALFLAAYVGNEVATGSLIVTFLQERNITTVDEAYLVNSAFWGSLSGTNI
jgi:fucose permease